MSFSEKNPIEELEAMTAEEVVAVVGHLDLLQRVQEVTIERREQREEGDAWLLQGQLHNGQLWVVKPGEYAFGAAPATPWSKFALAPLPPDHDYRVSFWIGRGTRATRIYLHSLDEFQQWRGNPQAVRRSHAVGAERERVEQVQKQGDEQRKVRQLMKLANYKNRSFGFLSQGATCRGCGHRYRDGLHGPSTVRELLRDHRPGCPSQAAMKQIVDEWDSTSR